MSSLYVIPVNARLLLENIELNSSNFTNASSGNQSLGFPFFKPEVRPSPGPFCINDNAGANLAAPSSTSAATTPATSIVAALEATTRFF